jgi:hypothetical protein
MDFIISQKVGEGIDFPGVNHCFLHSEIPPHDYFAQFFANSMMIYFPERVNASS